MSTARRYELSDFEWSIIQPLLPNKPRGVPRADDRKVLNGIYWRLRTGSPWADIPERYGPPRVPSGLFADELGPVGPYEGPCSAWPAGPGVLSCPRRCCRR